MKTVEINLYTLAELNPVAKEKAINEAIVFLDSEPEEYEDEDGKMQHEYLCHNEGEAEEFINANEYLFFYNGEQADAVVYCGKHLLAGETEFKLFGETYIF